VDLAAHGNWMCRLQAENAGPFRLGKSQCGQQSWLAKNKSNSSSCNIKKFNLFHDLFEFHFIWFFA